MDVVTDALSGFKPPRSRWPRAYCATLMRFLSRAGTFMWKHFSALPYALVADAFLFSLTLHVIHSYPYPHVVIPGVIVHLLNVILIVYLYKQDVHQRMKTTERNAIRRMIRLISRAEAADNEKWTDSAVRLWKKHNETKWTETFGPCDEQSTIEVLSSLGSVLGVPLDECSSRAVEYLKGPACAQTLASIAAVWKTKERSTRYILLAGSAISLIVALTGKTTTEVGKIFTRKVIGQLDNWMHFLESGLVSSVTKTPTEPTPDPEQVKAETTLGRTLATPQSAPVTETADTNGITSSRLSLGFYFITVVALWKGGTLPRRDAGTLTHLASILMVAKGVHSIAVPILESMFGIDLTGKGPRIAYGTKYLAYGRELSNALQRDEIVSAENIQAAETWVNTFQTASRSVPSPLDPAWGTTYTQVVAAIRHARSCLARGHEGPTPPWIHFFSGLGGTGKSQLIKKLIPDQLGQLLNLKKDHRACFDWGGAIGSTHANTYGGEAFAFVDEFGAITEQSESMKQFDLARQLGHKNPKVSGASVASKEQECFLWAVFSAANRPITEQMTMSGVSAEMKAAIVTRVTNIEVRWEGLTERNRNFVDRTRWLQDQYFVSSERIEYYDHVDKESKTIEPDTRFGHLELIRWLHSYILHMRSQFNAYTCSIPGLGSVEGPECGLTDYHVPIRDQAPKPSLATPFPLANLEDISPSFPVEPTFADRVTQKIQDGARVAVDKCVDRILTGVMETAGEIPPLAPVENYVKGYVFWNYTGLSRYWLMLETGLPLQRLRPVCLPVALFRWWFGQPFIVTGCFSYFFFWLFSDEFRSVYRFRSTDDRGVLQEIEQNRLCFHRYAHVGGMSPDVVITRSGYTVRNGRPCLDKIRNLSSLASAGSTQPVLDYLLTHCLDLNCSMLITTRLDTIAWNVSHPGAVVKPTAGKRWNWDSSTNCLVIDNCEGAYETIRFDHSSADHRVKVGEFLASGHPQAEAFTIRNNITTADALSLQALYYNEKGDTGLHKLFPWIPILLGVCSAAFIGHKIVNWLSKDDTSPLATDENDWVCDGADGRLGVHENSARVRAGSTSSDPSVPQQKKFDRALRGQQGGGYRGRKYYRAGGGWDENMFDSTDVVDSTGQTQSSLHALRNQLLGNIVRVQLLDKGTFCLGWALTPHTIVTVSHGLRTIHEDGTISYASKCLIKHEDQFQEATVVTNRERDDIMVLSVQKALPVRSLHSKILPDRSVLNKHKQIRYMVPLINYLAEGNTEITWQGGHGVYNNKGFHTEVTGFTDLQHWGPGFTFSTDAAEMKPGSSGTPYLVQIDGFWWIGGMQRASKEGCAAIATLITSKVFTEAFTLTSGKRQSVKLKPDIVESTRYAEWDTGVPLCVIPGQDYLDNDPLPEGFDPFGPYDRQGSSSHYFPSAGKTKIKPRPLSDLAAQLGFPRLTQPVWPPDRIYREAADRIPDDKNGRKYIPATRMAASIRDKHLDLETFSKFRKWATILAKEDVAAMGFPEGYRAYSVPETLNHGYSGATTISPQLAASAGPSLIATCDVRKKGDIIRRDAMDQNQIDLETEGGRLLLEQLIMAREISEQGRTWIAGNILKLKDEQLPDDKLWRPRVFNSRDFFAVLIEKMVLGPIQSLFQQHAEVVSPQLGISWPTYATKWMELNQDFGDFAASMDYSGFDFSVSAQWLEIAEAYFCQLAEDIGYSNKDLRLLKAVFRSIVNQVNIYGRDVLATNGTMPSGMWGTSLIDSVLVYLIWTFGAAEAFNLEPYAVKDWIRISAAGDDSHAVVRRGSEKDFPLLQLVEQVRSWGFKLTTAAKDGEEIEDWAPLWQTSFLSLTFYPATPNLVLIKRKDASLAKILHWTKHDDASQWYEEMREVLSDLVADPQDNRFPNFMRFWIAFGKETGFPITPSSYRVVREELIRELDSKIANQCVYECEDITPIDRKRAQDSAKEAADELKGWTDRIAFQAEASKRRKTDIIELVQDNDFTDERWKWITMGLQPSVLSSLTSVLLDGKDPMLLKCDICLSATHGAQPRGVVRPLCSLPMLQPEAPQLEEVLQDMTPSLLEQHQPCSSLSQDRWDPNLPVLLLTSQPHEGPCSHSGLRVQDQDWRTKSLQSIIKAGNHWFPVAEGHLLPSLIALSTSDPSHHQLSGLLHGLATKWESLSLTGQKQERKAARMCLQRLKALQPQAGISTVKETSGRVVPATSKQRQVVALTPTPRLHPRQENQEETPEGPGTTTSTTRSRQCQEDKEATLKRMVVIMRTRNLMERWTQGAHQSTPFPAVPPVKLPVKARPVTPGFIEPL